MYLEFWNEEMTSSFHPLAPRNRLYFRRVGSAVICPLHRRSSIIDHPPWTLLLFRLAPSLEQAEYGPHVRPAGVRPHALRATSATRAMGVRDVSSSLRAVVLLVRPAPIPLFFAHECGRVPYQLSS
ncbi:hypothetical protein SCP_1600230 [Sparassis crispa]|uniref:Uncharacterized protein n=1 Tax=Sparassis crispa TaxID=139825 RepID=A0A401H4M2_9APHY|nr:hypothetical protein SCP_1600230 [Sparassis crispa]GBE89362.1 hypothetical protein SCP_1600230 [Sparassis crispa]